MKPVHSRPRRPAFRPRLEVLEDRRLLTGPGSLDPTFGNGAGYVSTPITSFNDIVRRALIQPDGKILATGTAGWAGTTSANLAVVRYNLDGSLDASFGSGGIAQAGFAPNNARDMGGSALQSDGKIVLAGEYSTSSGTVFALARFGTSGILDATFGNQGEVTTSFSVGTFGPEGGVVVQSDGKIVAVGDNGSAFEMARYNANGSLDTGFGTGGEVVTTFAQFPSLSARALLQQADGKLIVVGDTNANAPHDWVMARYNANGTLDTSFGTQGVVATPLSGEVAGGVGGGGAAVLYPNAGAPNDGKIVVAGSDDSTGTWQLVRYNAYGSLDANFGTGGVAVTNISGAPASVTLDANGRIVAAGVGAGAAELARFNLDGTLDNTFGSGGLVGSSSGGRAVAIYPNAGTANDGKVVVAGDPTNGTKYNFLVGRYLGDSTTLTVTGFASPDTAGVSGTFTVTVKDANGNTLTGYTGTVHFSSSDPQAVLPADYTFTAADQGSHTFSATLKTAGTQTLSATDTANGFLGSETGITVNPAAASALSVGGFPAVTNVGIAGSFTVAAVDAFGNQATGYTGTVHFSSSDPLAALPADYVFTAADQGSHTFSATLNTTGTQSLTATDTATGSITGTQAGITVNPAGLPAATLGVTGFPATVTAGAAGTFTVTARDANGNVAPSYRGTVHFTSSDPLAVLPPDYTFSGADQGVHTFAATLKTAGSRALTATDTATGSVTGSQAGIAVKPAAASHLSISAPASVTHGVAFTLTVTALDPFGNVATGYTGTVHFTSSDSTATLPANYAFTAGDGGVHTFVNKTTLRKRGTKTVTVTDTLNSGLTGSASLNVV